MTIRKAVPGRRVVFALEVSAVLWVFLLGVWFLTLRAIVRSL